MKSVQEDLIELKTSFSENHVQEAEDNLDIDRRSSLQKISVALLSNWLLKSN